VRVYFELYTLNSWDGNNSHCGPDLWEARVGDGPRLVYASFANIRVVQSYPLSFGLAETVRGTGGRRVQAEVPWSGERTWGEHIVYPMCFTVPHTAAELRLHFAGIGLQKLADESWALDNVGVALLSENPARELTAAQLDQAWKDLATEDVAAAWRATQALVAAGDQAVPFLVEHLDWPVGDATAARSGHQRDGRGAGPRRPRPVEEVGPGNPGGRPAVLPVRVLPGRPTAVRPRPARLAG